MRNTKKTYTLHIMYILVVRWANQSRCKAYKYSGQLAKLLILVCLAKMENNTIINNSVAAISDENHLSQWTRYFLISYMIIIATVGIPVNSFIIFVLSRFRGRTSTDVYVGAIAVTDLLSSSVGTVFYILRYESTTWMALAPNVFCYLQSFLAHLTSVLATLIFAAIAHDRYKVTTSGISSMSLHDHAVKIAKRNCTIIAIFSCTYCMLYLLIITFDDDARLCSRKESYKTLAYILDSILVLIFIFFFVTTFFCYTKIFLFLKKNHERMRNLHRTVVRKISALVRPTTVYPQRENYTEHQSTSKGAGINHSKEGAEKGNNQGHMALGSSAAQLSSKETTISQGTKVANSARPNIIIVQPINPQGAQSNGSYVASTEVLSARRSEQVRATTDRSRKQMNRTTLLMFLLTLIYVSSWLINWSASIYEASTNSNSDTTFLLKKLFMFTSMTNPLLNILTSSKFRRNARNLLRNTWIVRLVVKKHLCKYCTMTHLLKL